MTYFGTSLAQIFFINYTHLKPKNKKRKSTYKKYINLEFPGRLVQNIIIKKEKNCFEKRMI